MLFHVEGTEVYLAGSVHHGKPSFYPLPRPAEEAFRRSEKVWFEAAPVANHPLLRCPEGTTLRDLVSARTYDGARRRFLFNFEKLKTLKPWVLALELVRLAYAEE